MNESENHAKGQTCMQYVWPFILIRFDENHCEDNEVEMDV